MFARKQKPIITAPAPLYAGGMDFFPLHGGRSLKSETAAIIRGKTDYHKRGVVFWDAERSTGTVGLVRKSSTLPAKNARSLSVAFALHCRNNGTNEAMYAKDGVVIAVRDGLPVFEVASDSDEDFEQTTNDAYQTLFANGCVVYGDSSKSNCTHIELADLEALSDPQMNYTDFGGSNLPAIILILAVLAAGGGYWKHDQNEKARMRALALQKMQAMQHQVSPEQSFLAAESAALASITQCGNDATTAFFEILHTIPAERNGWLTDAVTLDCDNKQQAQSSQPAASPAMPSAASGVPGVNVPSSPAAVTSTANIKIDLHRTTGTNQDLAKIFPDHHIDFDSSLEKASISVSVKSTPAPIVRKSLTSEDVLMRDYGTQMQKSALIGLNVKMENSKSLMSGNAPAGIAPIMTGGLTINGDAQYAQDALTDYASIMRVNNLAVQIKHEKAVEVTFAAKGNFYVVKK